MRRLAGFLGGIGLLHVMSAVPVHAEVALSGTFTVAHACPAYQSIRKGTNPGAVTVEPGKSYDVLAGNKPDATHYRVVVEGARPAERWVSTACGTLASGAASPQRRADKPIQSPGAAAAAAAAGDSSGARPTHVLALGWQPAFCAKHQDKNECRSLTGSNFFATHLSLHGLWPQPRGTQYCNVAADVKQFDLNHDWNSLPEPAMRADTLQRLAAVMPGVQSKLQRHEWIVHGTCFGGDADGYFNRAAGLASAVQSSKVSQLFADNAGRNVSAAAIRAAFDDAFGAGTGARVTVSCNGRGDNRKITEIVLNLAGDVAGSAPLGDLMRAAQALPAGCPGGLIAPAP